MSTHATSSTPAAGAPHADAPAEASTDAPAEASAEASAEARRDGASPPANDAVFRAQGLAKIYAMGEVEVRALNDTDLTLHRGELVVILGPSGSGKSTLLNILGGLDVPTRGEVSFGSHRLDGADEAQLTSFRREHVGFVFQFFNLLPSLTALENVHLVTEIAERPLDPAEALRMVGLGERLNHFPAQLSGGEQQRVAIARAIAKRPDVLLCDEPTGSLDYETGKRILEVLDEVNRSTGTLTVLVTHNAAIAQLADRVLHMRDGRIVDEQRNKQRARPDDIRW